MTTLQKKNSTPNNLSVKLRQKIPYIHTHTHTHKWKLKALFHTHTHKYTQRQN